MRFIAILSQTLRASSQARYISTLRRFYRHLLARGRISVDPTLKIAMPAKPSRLPKVLSEVQVEALLDAPKTDTLLGQRDRAMLETLYASGLRVSELVGLRLHEVNFDMGVLRVFGKGSKERLVPLGEEAIDWLRRYLADARPALLGQRQTDDLFVTARASAMTRQAFWQLIKRYALQAGMDPARLSPTRPASRLCHASAQSRRRSARRADVARPFGHFDHADLHAYCPRTPEIAARRASSAWLIIRCPCLCAVLLC